MRTLFQILNASGEFTARERYIGMATAAAVILVALFANL